MSKLADSRPQVLHVYEDFADAARSALQLLQRELGMGLWVFTRTSDEHWIVLAAANQETRYDVKEGEV